MVSEVSILIPVFNYDITFLVHQLLEQCQRTQIQFEIICLDDGSGNWCKKINQKVKNLKEVIYEELSHNIGRAAIRNNLARRAQYAYLLFLDNDSRLVSPQFIADYLQAANHFSVLIGGTVYQTQPPPEPFKLHWYYGKQREQREAVIRQKQPYRQLQVNNLFVSRTLYLSHPIPEIIKTYGHEDTLWGKHLENAQVPIIHIDNPVCHLGLEPTPKFLYKTEQAIHNLANLNNPDNNLESTLSRAYKTIKKAGMEPWFWWIFKKMQPLLLRQLHSNRPNLGLFDIYKLGLFVQARKKVRK